MNVLTNRNDNARTGRMLNETALTATSVAVARFGKLFTRDVQGAIYAQPLYVSGISLGGKTRNVVYVATMHNYVYAFDADDPAAAPLWGPVSLGHPVYLPDPGIGLGDRYRDIQREIGVLSTPVISLEMGAIFVVAMSGGSGTYAHTLHKMDLVSGAELGQVAVPGAHSVTGFQNNRQNQRAALTLSGSNIYIAFAGFQDTPPYHGYVFGYDAAMLAPIPGAVFNVTPSDSFAIPDGTKPDYMAGGIWQAGQGLSVDAKGNLYCVTGNGTFDRDDPGGADLGDCVVKLGPTLDVLDWYSPANNNDLNQFDLDLGSSGVLLLPGVKRALVGGKEGRLHLLDTDSLGKFIKPQGANTPPDTALQVVTVHLTPLDEGRSNMTHHIHGSPAFWEAPNGPFVYVWPENDTMYAFRYAGDRLEVPAAMKATTTDPEGVPGGSAGMPGGILSISANGAAAGSGIVWVSHSYTGDANQHVVDGVLRAYDAEDITRELWNSKQNAARDDLGNFAKFCPPTIANGKVYMATMGGLQNKVTLDETAIEGPALVALGDRLLVLAWTGTDRTINVMTSPDGRTFSGKSTLAGSTGPHGPALSYDGVGDRLFLAWTGDDAKVRVRIASGVGSPSFGIATVLGESSPFAPALAFGGGRLYLAWVGTDPNRSLNVAWSIDGGTTFGGKVTLVESATTAPALTFLGGQLHLLWVGTDPSHSLNRVVSTDGGATFGGKTMLADNSDHRPALVARALQTDLFWTGRDSNQSLNLLVSDAAAQTFENKATYDDGSVDGPAAAFFRGRVRIGWTGTDPSNRLNVAVVSSGELAVYGLL